MANNVQNVSGITAMGNRATQILNSNAFPMVSSLDTRGGDNLPLLIDQGNAAASRAIERKGIASAVQRSMPGANINIAYDLKEDLAAMDEERKYRAAITFMQWIIQTYDNDAFSMHVMFEKHPFLKQMVEDTITYWCGLVRSTAIAKLMPRTHWDESTENLLFRMYTMEPSTRESFIRFVQSNPFLSQSYPQEDPIKRGPFNMRQILSGVSEDTKALAKPFNRAIGGYGPYANQTTLSIEKLFKIGGGQKEGAFAILAPQQ